MSNTNSKLNDPTQLLCDTIIVIVENPASDVS
jgi:hypothetical protein